ncbi:MAG: hypothetical protein NT056_06775 [Proteobacteria bacterium]|nr:hypothetical protein [Pseudomonadota bacterium]
MKAFAPKILLFLAVILPLPNSSQAYSLLDDNIRLAAQTYRVAGNSSLQNSDEIEAFRKTHQRKSPGVALALAASPIFLSALTWFIVGDDKNEERNSTLGISTFFLVFGTIPAHIYCKDTFAKTVLLTSAKLGGAIVTAIGIAWIVWEKDGFCIGTCEEEHNYTGPVIITALGSVLFAGTYIYELIDIPLSADRYDKKNQLNHKSAFIIPSATKDRVGLALQVNF